VARVGDERALVFQPLLEAGEHLVQGAAKPLDLVAAVGQRQPCADITGGDRRRSSAHRLDRAKRGRREQVAGGRRDEQRERPAEE
jgi:hypothetical protein